MSIKRLSVPLLIAQSTYIATKSASNLQFVNSLSTELIAFLSIISLHYQFFKLSIHALDRFCSWIHHRMHEHNEFVNMPIFIQWKWKSHQNESRILNEVEFLFEITVRLQRWVCNIKQHRHIYLFGLLLYHVSVEIFTNQMW